MYILPVALIEKLLIILNKISRNKVKILENVFRNTI